MKKQVACLGLLIGGLAIAGDFSFITFDDPNEGTASGQGTTPIVRSHGVIDGYYADSSGVSHGFLRLRNGKFVTFDPANSEYTLPFGMNERGEIAGIYFDSNGPHGFLRRANGESIAIDVPGAAGTYAANINSEGAVGGDSYDSNDVSHAYIRSPSGKITVFSAPGAGTGQGQGTQTGFIDCINDEGSMTGYFNDSNNVFHGYVRSRNGTFATFDPPGSTGTFSAGIDDEGRVTGYYFDSSGIGHGFVREANGRIISFDVPGNSNGQGTFPGYINPDRGVIVGQYVDAAGANHGFLRTRAGRIITYAVQGAGTGNGQGVVPNSIDEDGEITGVVVDSNNVLHGFTSAMKNEDD
jgi:hypothetical protein